MKFLIDAHREHVELSHPSRGAWIEIQRVSMDSETFYVAHLTGCVD